MKKILLFLVVSGLTGTASAAEISIVPPQVTSWAFGGDAAQEAAAIAEVNSQLDLIFADIEDTLNTELFSQLGDFKELNRGFANANAAAWDNATLNSFQTYDLFAVMLGGNLGVALPSTDPNKMGTALAEVVDKGDLYLGVGTGGVAGQFGLNTGFLVKDSYLSVKFGAISPVASTFEGEEVHGDVVFEQGMFGIGANITLWDQVDLLFGFIKWRGLSFGTGFTYNANTTTVTLITNDNYTEQASIDLSAYGGSSTETVFGTVKNNTAKLTIDSGSLVIPFEVMTSLQALWFANIGLGMGLDANFSSSRVRVSGSSDVEVSGLSNATFSTGSVQLMANDSKNGGDFLVPRLMASLGLNLTVLKVDIPLSYYPTTKAAAMGINLGIVW